MNKRDGEEKLRFQPDNADTKRFQTSLHEESRTHQLLLHFHEVHPENKMTC